jgi:hypothetical protein
MVVSLTRLSDLARLLTPADIKAGGRTNRAEHW